MLDLLISSQNNHEAIFIHTYNTLVYIATAPQTVSITTLLKKISS